MTHAERLDQIAAALGAGPLSVPQIATAVDCALTTAWSAMRDLMLDGRVVLHSYIPSVSYKGGSPIKLYCLATHGPHGNPLIRYVRKEKNAKRTDWKPHKSRRFNGSGVIAGRITIGRGSKWGAGLA